ncbi:hypothetical protein NEILACOT_04670 [Neisseria lactamica ATCC 23970]|uniref:Uncharacterized protein n=1 Tax=Neisseria lactamica ATCC 23970 TaxID=546265 RepID=D0WAU9_NEILA|nr:hypothetical protein NEILACOT_04670 [Neisseria lactamica ATCC 23970]
MLFLFCFLFRLCLNTRPIPSVCKKKAVFPFVQKSTPLNKMAFVRLIRAASTEY